LVQALWLDFFKGRLDQTPTHWSVAREGVSRWYFESASWLEVYDFVEFVFAVYPDRVVRQEGIEASNKLLEREMSAWRFVGGQLVEVTSESEIEAIEQALVDASPPAQTHLRAALTKLSDRTDPDYRNSIKESISAVEVVVSNLTGAKTLGAGLKKLPTPLHPALEAGLSKLYGWTSDAEGIRHALMEEPSVTSDDAKFMLVSCAAFVNYLTALGARAGG
jgi:AbiJ N-terminal domain 4